MKKSFFILFLFACSSIFGQNRNIDSLIILLKKDSPDTNKVNHLTSLAWLLNNEGAYSRADSMAREGLKLAENITFKKGIATSFSMIGIAYDYMGEYQPALEYYLKSLKASEEINDKHGVLTAYSNLGNVYTATGDYPQGLNYYLKALKIAEELNEKKKIASNLNNIGVVYKNQGDFTKALEYYLKSLKLAQGIGNQGSIANKLGNIGTIYYFQREYATALDYYFKALKIYEELGNKNGIARNVCNIGLLYSDEGNVARGAGNTKVMNEKYTKALACYERTYKIAIELGEKNLLAATLGAIGAIYTGQKKYREAHMNLFRALALSDSIGTRDYTMDFYGYLCDLYSVAEIPLQDSIGGKLLSREQMRLRALYYYKRSITIRDTLFSEENKKQLVQKEMNFEFEKKVAEAKADQDKKDAVAAAEKRKQTYVLFLVSFILLLVAFVAVIIFRSLRTTSRQKHVIEEQKELVEEKQKEILDSIHYAKRIQTALLPNEIYITKQLGKLIKDT